MEVTLIAYNRPLLGDGDLRRLVYLAVKTSEGKAGKRGFEYYLINKKESKKLDEVLLEAAKKYPSVLEHITFTFFINGCSRICSHQLVRHRIASYTQESQRYSILADPRAILDDVERLNACFNGVRECSLSEITQTLEKYFVLPARYDPTFYTAALRTYAMLLLEGVPPEDARFVLPQVTKTRILMTVNLRELLHIACVRLTPHAQWEIYELVGKMLDEVQKKTGIPIGEMKAVFCRGDR